jgi:hypothetical protein
LCSVLNSALFLFLVQESQVFVLESENSFFNLYSPVSELAQREQIKISNKVLFTSYHFYFHNNTNKNQLCMRILNWVNVRILSTDIFFQLFGLVSNVVCDSGRVSIHSLHEIEWTCEWNRCSRSRKTWETSKIQSLGTFLLFLLFCFFEIRNSTLYFQFSCFMNEHKQDSRFHSLHIPYSLLYLSFLYCSVHKLNVQFFWSWIVSMIWYLLFYMNSHIRQWCMTFSTKTFVTTVISTSESSFVCEKTNKISILFVLICFISFNRTHSLYHFH